MADSPEQKPKRRRRRKAASEAESASEAPRASETEGAAEGSDSTASSADSTSESEVDEIEPTAEDVEAEDEAADVVLEAEAEIDEDSEPEKPARSRRPRRRQAAEPEPPAQPAPRRRRTERDPSLPPPVVRAQAKYVRSSARKARLVCDHIRGKSVDEARAILAHTPRAVARDWSKLLESAIANAENNHDLVGEDLYIKAVHADEGPTIKRFRPRALGRATRIRKRTSHLTILLTPKE
jgi:large subunit ribosomal protein L22